MKFVPGTFCWLMYLSPFTLPPTFGHNKLCNSCLHRYSACPSPHSHGHAFMFFRLDRPIVSILYLQNIITCPKHSCTTCLESYHKIYLSLTEINIIILHHFSINKSVSFPHSLCKSLSGNAKPRQRYSGYLEV